VTKPLPEITAAVAAPTEGLLSLRRRVMGVLATSLDPRLLGQRSYLDHAPLYDAYLEYVASWDVEPRREKLPHLLRASVIDTTFMAPLLDAVWATIGLVYETRVDAEVDSALALRDSLLRTVAARSDLLSTAQRYRLEYLRAIFRGDRVGRYEAMRRMALVNPDLRSDLATPAFILGRYREAAELMNSSSYARVRPDPTWWKTVAAAYHFLGEHETELAHTLRGKAEHPGRMVFHEMETTALAGLGRVDQVFEAVEEAVALAGGDETFPLEAFLLATGVELLWHGHEEAARELFLRALEETRRKEAEKPPGTYSETYAQLFGYLGRWEELRAIAEREAGLVPRVYRARWVGYLGLAAAGMGDREEAMRRIGELEAMEEDPRLVDFFKAEPAMERAKIAAVLGDCEEAVRHLLHGFDRGLGHQLIHRRLGLSRCREHPAFRRVAAPTG